MEQLEEHCIILELASTSKDAVLHELAQKIHDNNPSISTKVIQKILTEREQLGSTGVGNGVAIPHGKIPGLEKLLLCFGRSTPGIAFDASDNQPVHLFVMILSPPGMAEEYLHILARVSRLLKEHTTRHDLLQATSKQNIWAVFEHAT